MVNLTKEHIDLLGRLIERGVVILQGERVNKGVDLVTLDLVIAQDCNLFGKPCFVVHGLTKKGFQYVLRSHFPLVSETKSFDDPTKGNRGGGNVASGKPKPFGKK